MVRTESARDQNGGLATQDYLMVMDMMHVQNHLCNIPSEYVDSESSIQQSIPGSFRTDSEVSSFNWLRKLAEV